MRRNHCCAPEKCQPQFFVKQSTRSISMGQHPCQPAAPEYWHLAIYTVKTTHNTLAPKPHCSSLHSPCAALLRTACFLVCVCVVCVFGVGIVCSKAAHRVSTLLQEHFDLADVTEGSPRLFASLLPPEEKKAAALRWGQGYNCCNSYSDSYGSWHVQLGRAQGKQLPYHGPSLHSCSPSRLVLLTSRLLHHTITASGGRQGLSVHHCWMSCCTVVRGLTLCSPSPLAARFQPSAPRLNPSDHPCPLNLPQSPKCLCAEDRGSTWVHACSLGFVLRSRILAKIKQQRRNNCVLAWPWAAHTTLHFVLQDHWRPACLQGDRCHTAFCR
jgi:hypothetical protein